MATIRELAIALLNDDHGVNAQAYELLADLLAQDGGSEDILQAVEATDDRVYLPEHRVPACTG